MMRQFITLSDKIFIEIFYLKYLYLQIPFNKFSKDAFSVWLCVENWGPWPPGPPGSVGPVFSELGGEGLIKRELWSV